MNELLEVRTLIEDALRPKTDGAIDTGMALCTPAIADLAFDYKGKRYYVNIRQKESE